MPTFQTFKDLSVTFKKHPVTDDLVTVKDKAAIAQSIGNLLLTRKGERPFQPDLGSDLYNVLFEPLDFGSAGIIRSSIEYVLKRYEPRILIENILISPDFDNNGYNVELFYRIIGREDVPVAAEFFLERTR
ncbi:MAG: GPW/gp25 family protein [Candidatus Nanopelagicaceae bacterium]